MRIRDLGYTPGRLPPGPRNSILDVPGVSVGQTTLIEGTDIRTGVTIILPRPEHLIQQPCYAGFHVLNGAGELTGCHQVKEWGWTNTPLAMTSSVALGAVYSAIWQYLFTIARANGQSEDIIISNYGAPVIGETLDCFLNNWTLPSLTQSHVFAAFERAKAGDLVVEGSAGGGTGMLCSQFKGGTGTASRLVPSDTPAGPYTLGVIVQTNYGLKQDLQIGGVPIGALLMREAGQEPAKPSFNSPTSTYTSTPNPPTIAGPDGQSGSILVYIITSAPLLPHQLTRLAQRATAGISAVTKHGIGLNPSGDIFLALSTANIPSQNLEGKQRQWYGPIQTNQVETVRDQAINGLFYAVAEATEEAILNSMVASAEGMSGWRGMRVEGLPVERVNELLKEHMVKR